MTVVELIDWLNKNAEPDMEVMVYDGDYMNEHEHIDPIVYWKDNPPYVFIGPVI